MLFSSRSISSSGEPGRRCRLVVAASSRLRRAGTDVLSGERTVTRQPGNRKTTVGRVRILVMALVALLAAGAGVMQSSEIMSGTATTATGWELDVIAAVIIGGTSLLGGEGRIRGTLVGVVFLGVLGNGMTLLNVNEYWQHVVRGALILGAVLLNQLPRRPG